MAFNLKLYLKLRIFKIIMSKLELKHKKGEKAKLRDGRITKWKIITEVDQNKDLKHQNQFKGPKTIIIMNLMISIKFQMIKLTYALEIFHLIV